MEFDEAVKNRRSIRKFKPDIEIPAADLEEIVKPEKNRMREEYI